MLNGHYLPNPALRLRVSGADGQEQWQPIYQVLNLPAIERGNGRGTLLGRAYAIVLEQAGLAPG